MLDKLKTLKDKYYALQKDIVDPEIIADNKKYIEVAKEYNNLLPIVETYETYERVLNDSHLCEENLKTETDTEMIELYKAELKENKVRVAQLEDELKVLLLPKDENDDKNVIIEIRGGAKLLVHLQVGQP